MSSDCLVMAPVVGSPSAEPLTTAEARTHCGIPSADTSHDTFLDSLVTAARQKWERDTDTVCITSTVTERMTDLSGLAIALAKRPVQSITSVQYVDSNGSTQTFSSANYSLLTHSPYAQVLLGYDAIWPSPRGGIGDVTITYVAGYNGASAVPKAWKQAMLLLVSHWFENRSAVNVGSAVIELPQAYEMLAMNWRRSTYP